MAFQKSFLEATKGKVIIGFLLACLALLLAWGVSKFVFDEMLNTVEKISAPNDRLRIVNELTHQTARLDQFQKGQVLNGVTSQNNFILETRRLRNKLDTLSSLFINDSLQLKRLKSIKKLLASRDKQFLMYLGVRETLVNTKSFSKEVQKLSELVSQRSFDADSTVLTQTSTSTTTLATDDGKSRGFLNRLFGKKKGDIYKIISEEFKVKRDTLNAIGEDSIIRGIKKSLFAIEQEQRSKSSRFLKKEADLANSSNAITLQMLNVLHEVEAETVVQIDANSLNAKRVVNSGVIQITVIILVFFFITLILGYLILADITKSNRYRLALELAKEEAEYHSSAKHRFLSNMSHEIRTPLQAILGYSELLLNQENPRKKDIGTIYNSATHLLQIVNEILDYNRIISGKFTFAMQDFNIRVLLDEVFAGMVPLAEQKNIQLVSNFDIEDNIYLKGDPFRLKQILFNILGNAVKFTVVGKIVFTVTCKEKDGDLHFNFIIEDTGIGFSDTDREKIFTEFEQIKVSNKHLLNKQGTGLGLAIVKELVDSLKGRIYVKSKLAIGTTFNIFLKYRAAEKPFGTQLISKNSLFTKSKVWVIDDDLLILELCGLVFNKNGIAYRSFSCATKVLEAEIDSEVNIVLVDMRLPEMSGAELFRLLRAKFPVEVKFYAITAQVLPDEMDDILKAGFEGIIMKPFKAQDLLAVFSTSENLKAENITVDLTSLKRMTMGDADTLIKILGQFEIDCLDDMASLNKYVNDQNIDEIRLIVHRLAGRISQIGASDLGSSFRLMEQKVASLKQLSEKEMIQISHLFANLKKLLLLLKNENYSIP